MKTKLWLFQLPVVLIFTAAYLVTETGFQGELRSHFISEKFYAPLQRIATQFTDWKFRSRGIVTPKNKIVIVEIDGNSIESKGRWPWHRDLTAQLIDRVFSHGAKVVGLDIVFAEEDRRVPEVLAKKLEQLKLPGGSAQFETDPVLAQTIYKHAGNLVLGWTSEATCRPHYANLGPVPKGEEGKPDESGYVQTVKFDLTECPAPVDHPQLVGMVPAGYDKFKYSLIEIPPKFDPWMTPVLNALTFVANLPEYNQLAEHTGYFSAFPDQDGLIRRTALLLMHGKDVYPSLPLEMARIGLDEKLAIRFDDQSHVASLGFDKSQRHIPVTDAGVMEINFRGPAHTFTYVSALEILNDKEKLEDELNYRKLAGLTKAEVLKDAYVLIGLTALGANDMRAFPFDQTAPGVEGHANILDNILSGDMLRNEADGRAHFWMLVLMVGVAILFAYAIQRLEAVPALVLFISSFMGFGIVDFKILFGHNNINWNSAFFYIEIFTIFLLTLAAKYVIEERSKKFVKGAFAKYVAPAVVDSILKHPEKLSVGGEKRDLTIMFSDIRSFTTFSERMDAKALAAFLNDYLGIMTKIVFANQGTLDKYIGDAIMAFWGAPLDQAQHALNACTCAIAMMKALAENKKRFLEQYGVDVNIGVGLNSGPVNVGNMGSTDNFAYTVIGDHVNLSSRLEGLTKAYGVAILTTRFTFDEIQKAAGALPPHRVLDHVKVKGKKNAVELIQVLDQDLPPQGLALFEEGRTLYAQQKWDEAIARFQQANSLLSSRSGDPDGPCQVYLERCRDFKAKPPEKDWDGSWEMHSK